MISKTMYSKKEDIYILYIYISIKTGFLVGSTPKSQQIAILIGTLASCLILGPILLKLNQSGTVYVPVAGNKDFAFPSSFHANPADYLKDSNGQPKRERLSGAQAGADPV